MKTRHLILAVAFVVAGSACKDPASSDHRPAATEIPPSDAPRSISPVAPTEFLALRDSVGAFLPSPVRDQLFSMLASGFEGTIGITGVTDPTFSAQLGRLLAARRRARDISAGHAEVVLAAATQLGGHVARIQRRPSQQPQDLVLVAESEATAEVLATALNTLKALRVDDGASAVDQTIDIASLSVEAQPNDREILRAHRLLQRLTSAPESSFEGLASVRHIRINLPTGEVLRRQRAVRGKSRIM